SLQTWSGIGVGSCQTLSGVTLPLEATCRPLPGLPPLVEGLNIRMGDDLPPSKLASPMGSPPSRVTSPLEAICRPSPPLPAGSLSPDEHEERATARRRPWVAPPAGAPRHSPRPAVRRAGSRGDHHRRSRRAGRLAP